MFHSDGKLGQAADAVIINLYHGSPMTRPEALAILGLEAGASLKDIKAAYRAKVKAFHPDRAGAGADAALQFQKVQEAYSALTASTGSALMKAVPSDESAFSNTDDDRSLPYAIVSDFMTRRDITVRFDGSMTKSSAMRSALNRGDLDRVLMEEDIDEQWIHDELMLELFGQGIRISASDISRAVRKQVRERRCRRRRDVLKPLYAPLSEQDKERACAGWTSLAEAAFVDPPPLVVACLQHFIWQVKCKSAHRHAVHHLMPVIFSPIQGSGKTTFVQYFLSPLRELASDPVLLSDLADPRSGEIFRFPVLLVDDMEKLRPELIPILKSLMTSNGFNRRRLGSSRSVRHPQRGTLIGTSNSTIEDLIADNSGHRRFVSLNFRNGEVAKGGDNAVWESVRGTDYSLLWRSVDVFAPSPIEPLVAELAAKQAFNANDPLLTWLCELDTGAEAVVNITTRHGVPARDLYNLFLKQTGDTLSESLFGKRMKTYVHMAAVPFGFPDKREKATYYPLKKRT